MAAFGNPVVPLVYIYKSVSLGLPGIGSKGSFAISFSSAAKDGVFWRMVVDGRSGELNWKSGISLISDWISLTAENKKG